MTDIANPVLYDMGLRAAVEALAEDVKARQGIPCTGSLSGRLADLGQGGKGVSVTVSDDGTDFDAEWIGPAGAEGGFGLFSIRERVTSCGGKIAIESGTGKGPRVTVELPKTAGGAGPAES